jgi:rhodanese-related sulfurtransferase
MKKLVLLILLAFSLTAVPVLAGSVQLMDKDELKPMLGNDDLVILDVRAGRDWSTSEFKIAGAVRADGSDFKSWGMSYPKEKKLVLYCA